MLPAWSGMRQGVSTLAKQFRSSIEATINFSDF
jgi:hypothetical protein